ncbi:MAG: ketoacyl-ACP synthase III [Muribaculaceae bacterium]|nr:ketoacyl-ACP synthase III [Muribaculaceae bacterium]
MAFIKAISYVLPDKIVSNEELVKEFPEWTVDKIANKVGVNNRHIVKENETATNLAIKAAEKLFEDHPEIKKEDIDFIILCTQSPDYFLPTSACIIQDKLGLPTSCGAFDFNLGCSGYIYGLAIAKGLIAGGIATNILLLTAETYTKHLHPKDKGNRTIFGDAATATIVSTEGWAEIEDFSLGTDGRGAENLIVKTGGMRNPEKVNDLEFDENGNPISSDYLFMNGAKIFTFTQKNVPLVVKDCLEKNHLSMEDINLVIFHQANSYMLEFLRNKMKIPKEKFFINMAEIGNTVSNSIPIALADAKLQGLIPANFTSQNSQTNAFNILLTGFGVGYSWGACILKVNS